MVKIKVAACKMFRLAVDLLVYSNNKFQIAIVAVNMWFALGHKRVLKAVPHARLDFYFQKLFLIHISNWANIYTQFNSI